MKISYQCVCSCSFSTSSVFRFKIDLMKAKHWNKARTSSHVYSAIKYKSTPQKTYQGDSSITSKIFLSVLTPVDECQTLPSRTNFQILTSLWSRVPKHLLHQFPGPPWDDALQIFSFYVPQIWELAAFILLPSVSYAKKQYRTYHIRYFYKHVGVFHDFSPSLLSFPQSARIKIDNWKKNICGILTGCCAATSPRALFRICVYKELSHLKTFNV